MKKRSWHFITGEYPPQQGGVSDYCWQITRALASLDEEVHVWSPPSDRPAESSGGVRVHRLRSRFGLRCLYELSALIEQCPSPRRVFVQYVANALGWRAMNLPFCLWLLRHRADPIWVMFHEYAYVMSRRQKLSHNLLGLVTPVMGAIAAARADRVFVSIPAWGRRMPSFVQRSTPITWLPIPSNIPDRVDDERVSAARKQIEDDRASVVIGHFGTYSPRTSPLLSGVLTELLGRDPDRIALLIGRKSGEFAMHMKSRHPDLRKQFVATGALPAGEVAAHLRACDLLVQPYPDGVTSRRGSLMAGLALGLPIATNLGRFTDPAWVDSDAVALAGSPTPGAIAAAAEELLSSRARRAEVGRRAAALYAREFSLARSLDTIRALAAEDDAKDPRLGGSQGRPP